MTAPHSHEPDWVHGHPHEPNPAPPSEDASFSVILPDGTGHHFSVERLQQLPFTQIENCIIVSTGHGTSGPFCFGGVRLLTLLNSLLTAGQEWSYADVQSGDHFGTRIFAAELLNESAGRTSLLAWQIDGVPLTRQRGLVRLIVPSEVDDALKQVKWVKELVIYR